ncbi:hypothetical protein BD626DRAFT_188277 [Schizophyllum amplum]|uniref:Uncharacterized protein n=1 Tax=Schizophyllum amplum TaxID=97359 RepID=A0A550C087_9AGAR|nr:hypothetical protein BD626DRAFT_188277 [Auriculariopsis ampla]
MQANEFNLVFCGLATAAATIGYACSRRLSGSRSSRPTDLHEKTPNDLEAGLPSIGQKRKRMDHDFDEVKSDIGYPHNLKQIYPHKRARTPTPPPEAATTSALQSLGTAFEMLPSTQGTSTTPQQEVPVYTQSVQQELPSDDQPSVSCARRHSLPSLFMRLSRARRRPCLWGKPLRPLAPSRSRSPLASRSTSRFWGSIKTHKM